MLRTSCIVSLLAVTFATPPARAGTPDALCSGQGCLDAAMAAIEVHDLRRAAALYATGCADGNATACHMFATFVRRRMGGGGVSVDGTEAVLGAACASGSKPACGDYGKYYAHPDSWIGAQLVANVWARACYPAGDEPVDADACNELGQRSGSDEEKAAHFGRACEAGREDSCEYLRLLRACFPAPNIRVDAKACHALAQRTQDVGSVERYLLRGCAEGEGASCREVAHRLLEGLGGPSEIERARKFYELGCRRGDAEACRWVQADKAIPEPALLVAPENTGLFATGGLPVEGPSSTARGLQVRAGFIGTGPDVPTVGELFYAGSYTGVRGHGFGLRTGMQLLSAPRGDRSTWSLLNLAVQWNFEWQWFRRTGFDWSHGPVVQNRLYFTCAFGLTTDVSIPLRHADLFGITLEAGLLWAPRQVTGPGYSRCRL